MSPPHKITNFESSSQMKLVKRSQRNKVNDLLINKTTQGTLYNNLLSFCDTEKKFELQGDFLKRKLLKTIMLMLLNYRIKNNV